MGGLDLNQEGYGIVRRAWQMFWNDREGRFVNPNNSDGTYGSEHIYVVWPVSVMLQSIVDAARIYPKEISPMIKPAFASLERYYNPEFHGYNASHHFNGNKDLYYDDNAQVASAYLTAFEVTHDSYFLQRGLDVVNFLLTGVEEKKYGGGIKWHIDKRGSNTIAAAESGIACMRLAQFLPPEQGKRYIDHAQFCCDWIFNNVQDDDKLICDGLEIDREGGGTKRNQTKWTYNQGTSITLCCHLSVATGDNKYVDWATELALAVTDHNTAIFDRDTLRMDARYYRDSTSFYHHLAEGLADYLLFLGKVADEKVVNQIKGELLHTIKYVYTYLRDPKDGLYWQNFELFRINRELYEKFKELTGENKEYQPSAAEREHTDADIDDRPMAKCLMGCGCAGRIFFQTARVHQTVQFD
ncbi:hypothetical protein TRVA0_024S01992 [Trichomonascus vanleenenianus]|uniref:uncharacterized protein n=1 Tax=Trichomonascus vanleenenianus TaxID=2268995 RepID=UPI003ECAD215